jgi:hypothetical protein
MTREVASASVIPAETIAIETLSCRPPDRRRRARQFPGDLRSAPDRDPPNDPVLGHGLIEPFQFVQYSRSMLWTHRLGELVERRSQSAHHLHGRRAVLTYLGDTECQEVLPATHAQHHAWALGSAPGGLEIGRPSVPKRRSEVVEHLHRRRRVVYSRRQGSDGEVDQDPDGERRILLDRPLVAERNGATQVALGALVVGSAAHLQEWRRGRNKSPTTRVTTTSDSCVRAQATKPSRSIAWIAPDRLERTTKLGSARVVEG